MKTKLLKSRLLKTCWAMTAQALVVIWLWGCSTNTSHHKEWIGVFMFDSITAGAVLLEYDKDVPDGNTFGSIDEYNVNVDLFRYDFEKRTLKKDRRLFKNMRDAGMYRATDYNPPLLLQGARYGDETVIFNLETGEQKTLGVRVSRFSAEKNFYINSVALIDARTMDTVINLVGKKGSLFIYSENENITGVFVSDSASPRNIMLQIKQLNNGSSDIVQNLPRMYFDDRITINWSENLVPFYSPNPDSISVACNFDSLLQAKTACDTFPRASLPLEFLSGSFKTNHFIGIREDGLYACSGRDSCQVEQISSGGVYAK